ncbi:uncharacterized protein LOC126656348 [Mercurialis annua]|uniref:uncharacterized protein LOC126656348 n=1 Tax=Mercurialis annua TaxID=3986 RepID=UPI00215F607B|nr:uncharacterized protein LOC126656348 [Mercurialis annua]
MEPESSNASFDRAYLKGRNVGAAMTIRNGGSTGEHRRDSCCINIYINNNIQGVNNSILLGSEVKLRDPGVHIFLEDLKMCIGETCMESNKKKKNENDLGHSKLGFPAIFTAFIIVLLLFLTIS